METSILEVKKLRKHSCIMFLNFYAAQHVVSSLCITTLTSTNVVLRKSAFARSVLTEAARTPNAISQDASEKERLLELRCTLILLSVQDGKLAC